MLHIKGIHLKKIKIETYRNFSHFTTFSYWNLETCFDKRENVC